MFSDKRLSSTNRTFVPSFVLAAFALGLGVGGAAALILANGGVAVSAATTAVAVTPTVPAVPALRTGHPVAVLSVYDGDTFNARVNLWPGLQITTRVRLRGIDAPEIRARCPAERDKALAARDALRAMLDQGAAAIAEVGLDKYGGRVLATASTARTPDVATALLIAGLVRRYDGGRRQAWC